jgi:hypothetical protein
MRNLAALPSDSFGCSDRATALSQSQGRMTLTRIEPDHNNPELQTFECSRCEFVYKLMSADR